MENTSDRVASVALAVSLIALLISLMQLLAQVCGTADGYRRCSEAVIGPWHWLRWRRWLWTEFRYETYFITPKITLISRNPEKYAQIPQNDAPKLSDGFLISEIDPRKHERLWRHRDWRFLSRRLEDDARRDAEYVLAATVARTEKDNSDHEPKELKKKSALIRTIRELRPHHGPFFKSRVYGLSQPNDNVATWLGLIKTLYQIYNSYPGHVNGVQSDLALSFEQVKSQERTSNSYTGPKERINESERQVQISFSSCNWDIMPIDVTRPLSRTTLGALVVLAVRMGMEWRSLDVVQGRMLASGNGFNLSFIEMPGLGWVARLDYAGDHSSYPRLIPGVAAEKLLFGIIPVCVHLVKADICCPTVKESFDRLNMLETLRRELPLGSFAEEIKDKMCDPKAPTKPLYRAFDNDVIALLSQFLPIASSAASAHYCWSWQWAPHLPSFHFWECRLALWRDLYKRRDTLSEDLSIVLRCLGHLKENFPIEYYSVWDHSAHRKPDNTSKSRADKLSSLLRDCRLIYDWTTRWFQRHHFDNLDPDLTPFRHETRTRYVQLVISHWRMSYQVTETAEKAWTNMMAPKDMSPVGVAEETQRKDRAKKHSIWQLDDVPPTIIDYEGRTRQYQMFASRWHEMMVACIAGVEQKDLIGKDMREKVYDAEKTEFKTAWWVLMLRGHVWYLATRQETKGSPIPSMYYEDATPVWIS